MLTTFFETGFFLFDFSGSFAIFVFFGVAQLFWKARMTFPTLELCVTSFLESGFLIFFFRFALMTFFFSVMAFRICGGSKTFFFFLIIFFINIYICLCLSLWECVHRCYGFFFFFLFFINEIMGDFFRITAFFFYRRRELLYAGNRKC